MQRHEKLVQLAAFCRFVRLALSFFKPLKFVTHVKLFDFFDVNYDLN